jgi:hypothetical protein
MEPFQEQFVVVLAANVGNDGEWKTVPPRKFAVIEHVSIYAIGTGVETADYFISSTIGDDFREVPIVTTRGGTGAVLGSHPIRAFANPGTQYGAVIRRSDATERIAARFVLAGYYHPLGKS